MRTASTHVHVEIMVRMYELVGAQLKGLIRLHAFPGIPAEMVMDAAQPALFRTDYKKEMCIRIMRMEILTWAAWRQVAFSRTV